jgi:hypothetical protein
MQVDNAVGAVVLLDVLVHRAPPRDERLHQLPRVVLREQADALQRPLIAPVCGHGLQEVALLAHIQGTGGRRSQQCQHVRGAAALRSPATCRRHVGVRATTGSVLQLYPLAHALGKVLWMVLMLLP